MVLLSKWALRVVRGQSNGTRLLFSSAKRLGYVRRSVQAVTLRLSAHAAKAGSGNGHYCCSVWYGSQRRSPMSSAIALGSARARRASSGSGLWRCSARCGGRSWSPTSSILQCREQRVRNGQLSQGPGGGLGACRAAPAGLPVGRESLQEVPGASDSPATLSTPRWSPWIRPHARVRRQLAVLLETGLP